MPYNVFKDANNNLITAPNESGEIVLKSSILRQIRIEVNHNTYQLYDIAEKRYLSLSEIRALDPKLCHFTAIIYPCSSALDPSVDISLVESEENYPIVYKFVNSCLGSTLSLSHITDYNGKYFSNNIYFTNNSILNPITIEFEFQRGVKIGLNLFPSGLDKDTTFDLASNDVEIISLFQHNITIEAIHNIAGATNTRYLYSLSFSFINNRYEQYSIAELSTKDQMTSIIEDLPLNDKYPASGLIYRGRYASSASTMSIAVYTIINIYSNGRDTLYVNALLTGKNSGSTSSNTVDNITASIPSTIRPATITDDVIKLS